MGFLYPWGMIRGNQIPARNDFDAMRQIVMEALRPRSDVVAASIYGSVWRGDYTCRSDIDLAVVCKDATVSETRKLVRSLRVKAKARHIVLNAHVHTVTEARAGHHPFGLSYRFTIQETQKCHRECKKGNLVKYFWRDVHILHEDVRREMEHKLSRYIEILKGQSDKLSKQRNGGGTPVQVARVWLTKSYQEGRRPFHFYISFARWMLWWHQFGLSDDSKDAVVRAFLDEKSFRVLWSDFSKLRELDLAYDQLLARARKKAIGELEYHEKVYQMVLMVHQTLRSLFERARVFMHQAQRRKREQQQRKRQQQKPRQVNQLLKVA